jgi:flavin reductase
VVSDEVRALLRRYPAGVAVVTVDTGRQPLGLTVGSFVPLSLDPPLAGAAISRQAALHELLREAGTFSVSLLAEGQEQLAQHFARGVPPIALWEGIELARGDGPPRLAGALGWLDCIVTAEVPAGTHTFFVGSVESVELGADALALVRVRGDWRAA